MTQALFTLAELDEQISAYKQALIALASAQSYTFNDNGTNRTVVRADLPQIRQTLEWLQRERLALTAHPGPQFFQGRPRR